MRESLETGKWGKFNDWSACSVTCGEGYRFRKRECFSSTDANKKIASDNCIGKNIEIQPCDITTCPSRFFVIRFFFFSLNLPCFKSMDHGHLGHHVQHFVELVLNNVIVRVFHQVLIVEIIHMNKELVEKQIVNVLLVKEFTRKECQTHILIFFRYQRN